LFPSDDTGLLQGTTEAAQGVSFAELVRLQQKAAAAVLADTNVEGYLSSVGAGGPAGAANQGRLFIALKPAGKRLPADQGRGAPAREVARTPRLRVPLPTPH